MVVSRRYVCNKRPEHIKGRAATEPFLEEYVRLYLVYGDMPRAFYHDLHAFVKGLFGELAESDKLGDLAPVRGIREAAGP